MSRLRIMPIVEGHGEEAAVPIVLRRVWTELLGQEYVDVLRPIRRPRSMLIRGGHVQSVELEKAVGLAAKKLAAHENDGIPHCILILLDADTALPCRLAPEILSIARACAPHAYVECVLANVEFETWFVAAAASLAKYVDIRGEESAESSPEAARSGKHWIEQRFRGVKYSETQDQPRLAATMDLALCRSKSASFDKLCRVLDAQTH